VCSGQDVANTSENLLEHRWGIARGSRTGRLPVSNLSRWRERITEPA
jgi:hypothetical protein